MQQGLFVAEGPKLTCELLGHFRLRHLFCTSDHENQIRALVGGAEVISERDMRASSLQQNPQGVLAVFELPKAENLVLSTTSPQIVLALDKVQDPGNLGTIIRLADWFGINHIVCNHGTVDAFAPKTVQASMGAIARVSVHYTDLAQWLSQQEADIYGTFMCGDNLYQANIDATTNIVIVMGNEGNGISSEIESLVNHHITIPTFPANSSTVESLNVAIATAITCAEFRRRQF